MLSQRICDIDDWNVDPQSILDSSPEQSAMLPTEAHPEFSKFKYDTRQECYSGVQDITTVLLAFFEFQGNRFYSSNGEKLFFRLVVDN